MPKYPFESIALNAKDKKIPVESDRDTYLGLEHLDPGTFVVSRFNTEAAPKGEKLLMKKGDVLFGKRRAYQRKVAIAPFDGIFSAHGMVLRPKRVIDPAFFPFFIRSDAFLDKAIDISVGSLSPTINWKDLKDLEFYLPPLERQKKLAKILWGIEEYVEKAKGLLYRCDDLIKSRFVEMFSCHKRVYLGQYINQIRGVSYKPQDLGNNDSEHVILLRANNITSSGLLLDDLQFVCRDKVQDEQFLKCHDSLVCASSGSIEVLGKHVYIDRDLDFVFGAFCKVLRPKRSAFSRFIDGFFRTDDYRSQIKELGQGTNINNLSNSSFDSIRLPLVSEEEALTFGKYICQIDKLKFNLQQAIDRAKKLSAKILNDALSAEE